MGSTIPPLKAAQAALIPAPNANQASTTNKDNVGCWDGVRVERCHKSFGVVVLEGVGMYGMYSGGGDG